MIQPPTTAWGWVGLIAWIVGAGAWITMLINILIYSLSDRAAEDARKDDGKRLPGDW